MMGRSGLVPANTSRLRSSFLTVCVPRISTCVAGVCEPPVPPAVGQQPPFVSGSEPKSPCHGGSRRCPAPSPGTVAPPTEYGRARRTRRGRLAGVEVRRSLGHASLLLGNRAAQVGPLTVSYTHLRAHET